MIRSLTAALFAFPILAGAAAAVPPQTMTYLGTDETSIRKSLEAFGYEVRSLGADETGFEAEILDGDLVYDVSVDPNDGKIYNVELDGDYDGDA
jgi:hypothetical protein